MEADSAGAVASTPTRKFDVEYLEISGVGLHCFYLAVADALLLTPADAAAIQHHAITDLMTEEEFIKHLAIGQAFATRAEYFATANTRQLMWGGHLELAAFSRAFDGRIAFLVFSSLLSRSQSPCWNLVRCFRDGSDETADQNIGKPGAEIFVCLHFTVASGCTAGSDRD